MPRSKTSDLTRLIRIIQIAPRRILGVSLLASLTTAGICSLFPKFRVYEALLTTPQLSGLQQLAQNPAPVLSGLQLSLAQNEAPLLDLNPPDPLTAPPPPLNEEVESFIRFKYADRPRSRFDQRPYLVAVADAGEDTLAYIQMIIHATDFASAEACAAEVARDVQTYFMGKLAAVETTYQAAYRMVEAKLRRVNTELDKVRSATRQKENSPVMLMLESSLKKDQIQFEQTLSAYRAAISALNTKGAELLLTKNNGQVVSPKTIKLSLAAGALTFLLAVVFTASLATKSTAMPSRLKPN